MSSRSNIRTELLSIHFVPFLLRAFWFVKLCLSESSPAIFESNCLKCFYWALLVVISKSEGVWIIWICYWEIKQCWIPSNVQKLAKSATRCFCAINLTNVEYTLWLMLLMEVFPGRCKSLAVDTPGSEKINKPWLIRKHPIAAFTPYQIKELHLRK